MQVGADIRKDALEERPLDADGNQHDARPRSAEHDPIAFNQAAPLLGVARRARHRIAHELIGERCGRNSQHRSERKEGGAPAEIVAYDAARGLAEQLAQHLTGQEPAEHLLALFVGHHVADIGQADRQDPRDGQAGEEARERQAVERPRQAAGSDRDRR